MKEKEGEGRRREYDKLPPKVLDRVKGYEFLERLLPGVGVGFLAGVVKPQGP